MWKVTILKKLILVRILGLFLIMIFLLNSIGTQVVFGAIPSDDRQTEDDSFFEYLLVSKSDLSLKGYNIKVNDAVSSKTLSIQAENSRIKLAAFLELNNIDSTNSNIDKINKDELLIADEHLNEVTFSILTITKDRAIESSNYFRGNDRIDEYNNTFGNNVRLATREVSEDDQLAEFELIGEDYRVNKCIYFDGDLRINILKSFIGNNSFIGATGDITIEADSLECLEGLNLCSVQGDITINVANQKRSRLMVITPQGKIKVNARDCSFTGEFIGNSIEVDGINCSFNSSLTNVDDKKVIYGDVNGDGKVNPGDLTLLRRYLLELIPELYSENWEIAADVSGNGVINNFDYTLIRDKILNNIFRFPAE